MLKKRNIRNHVMFGNAILFAAIFLFLILIVRGVQLSLSDQIDGINLKEFASARTTQTDVLPAKRGTIYDVNGNVLAQNVYSYTIIAYLDPSRTTNPEKPRHVVDPDMTAKALAPILEMEESKIKEILSKTTYQNEKGETKQVYQTEFGAKGKGLTELEKDEIVALQLPGIDFIETQKRYYPNGDFLSYTIGYAKSLEDGTIVGEMGIEQYFNEELSGEDGSVTYQKDLKGYKIANTPEIRTDAVAGKDIYLTIDDNIQFFVDQAVKTSVSKYQFESLNIMIADAHTGKILGVSNYPSFDPNIRNITNYLDPNVAIAIEPGSTMKIYSYMATMEAGVYKGDDKFMSGVYVTKDGTEIGDHDRNGWGMITYDRGFALSSNVGALNLVEHYIDSKTLKDYYLKLGFGNPTGYELPRETSGKIDFKYETEVFNAAFGQGITTTAIQNIKALTSLSNNGILLEPYIVDKIVDPTTGEIVYQGKKKELGRVASQTTVDKMIQLMRDVVTSGTGTPYYMEGYDIVAKTGTAQIPSTDGTGYLKGPNDVIRGFAGLYPGNDPQFIIYATVKKPNPNSTAPLSTAIKEIIQNIAKYMNISTEEQSTEQISNIQLTSYYNKITNEVVTELSQKNIQAVVIGDGTKIIQQYPEAGQLIHSKEKVFLVTNSKNITIPNMIGWSRREAEKYFNLININYTIEGTGYVTSQSIPEGTILTPEITMNITLVPKFQTEGSSTESTIKE